MHHDHLPVLLLPTDLDDHAAAALLECLYEAARLIENHYVDPLRRHRHADQRPQLLWPDDQPPF